MHPAATVAGPRRSKRIIVGEVCASAEDIELSTIVGSCITVCLYDPMARCGGMNHFLLPRNNVGAVSAASSYGDVAMSLLLQALEQCGGRSERMHAKVFGAAEVLRFAPNEATVGELNRQFVDACLKQLRIPIMASHIGGSSGMHVRFLCRSGQAFVRYVDRLALSDVTIAPRISSKCPKSSSSTTPP